MELVGVCDAGRVLETVAVRLLDCDLDALAVTVLEAVLDGVGLGVRVLEPEGVARLVLVLVLD